MDDQPGERPPASRLLDEAPSARYAASDAPASPEGSLTRAILYATPAALISLAVYLGFAGPLAFSAGLVIVAIFAGRTIGLAAKAGGGSVVSSDRRVLVAIGITIAWFVAAHVAVWLYARNEGGVLPLVDYLLQTFGPIVPLSGMAAVLAAWWTAR